MNRSDASIERPPCTDLVIPSLTGDPSPDLVIPSLTGDEHVLPYGTPTRPERRSGRDRRGRTRRADDGYCPPWPRYDRRQSLPAFVCRAMSPAASAAR